MTIRVALSDGAKKLSHKKISSASLDSEVLLAYALSKSREYLIAHWEKELKPAELKKYTALITRRLKFEPVAYLTCVKEFYGLAITVNKSVLIPRPETELLVSEIINIASADTAKGSKTVILDIGTGSGSIALALSQNLPQARILALDTSADALSLARINARRLKSIISFIKSDLLAKVKPGLIAGSIIAVNLPYLDKAEIKDFPEEIKQGLKFEPQSALFASKRGTALYQKLFAQITALPDQPKYLLAEIGSHNWRDFLSLAKKHFPKAKISVKKDLARRPRILTIEF